jgi:predicted RNA-binding protein (virulence factor B family)
MVDMRTLRDLLGRIHPDGRTTGPAHSATVALRPAADTLAKIAVIGEEGKVLGFGLPGAIVLPAEEPEAVLAAWHSLGEDVAVVVLTSRAARTLAGRTASWPLTAVMPP